MYMHEFIERIGGWMPIAILGGSLVIGAGILGVHAATSDSGSSGGLDDTSAEYQDGWNRAVSFKLPERYGLEMVVDECSIPVKYKTDPGPDRASGISFFSHWEYNGHQRKEWAHGCLDAERNLTDYKVPQQSWEG
ncbi:MAG: hypothetical protein JF597_14130 [Streptomyces sp.]|uniref:hypothetical protein n=1 Tax=Streptomyces sp. TaxID=1931 RepID=UPI0025DB0845|nr:hypothetical protein [Streptomyces sp.]MBW8794693.1 hypothetical protein [Streptomyces sp.]